MSDRILLRLRLCCRLIAVWVLFCQAGQASAQFATLPAPSAALKPAPILTELARGTIPMPANTPAAHASSLLAMPPASPAQMLAFWFAGERESAPNVQIAFSWFSRSAQAWMPARFVVNRHDLGKQLGFGIRRLGNPVAWRDADGRLHLFVVATGLGGWAAGRIVQLQQKGEATTWAVQSPDLYQFEPVQVLPLSWLWNISYLVRSAPLPLADGGMVLPVYFEIGTKYPAALRFDARGRFVGLTRISALGTSLQPSIVSLSDQHWLAYMRDHSAARKVVVAQTRDAGQSWQDLPHLDVANPGSSLAALRLPDGRYAMAYNSLPDSRRHMDLGISSDGLHWQSALALERATHVEDEFSYPALALESGQLWVSYTDQRRSIAWRRFAITAQEK